MRQRRSEPGRRDRLLQVALEVIVARGVAGATYRLIAEAADVPLGSMTPHSQWCRWHVSESEACSSRKTLST